MNAPSAASKFERGFKTWAENTSLALRESLELRQYDPLDTFALARYLDVRVLDIQELPLDDTAMRYLCSTDGDEWSAVTVRVGDVDVVVLNPGHPDGRKASTMAHELSHILRKHQPAQIFVAPQIPIRLRSYDQSQEAEADWLAGCLLLPRPALLHIATRGLSDGAACEHYGVSQRMLTYRRRMSGVEKQLNARRRAY